MSNLAKLNANVLNTGLIDLTNKIAQSHGLDELSGISPGANFRDLITNLYKKYQKQIVVLIDECDKPILDRIADSEAARANRDVLREFYAILKAQDQNLRFIFLTGVTKFSKVSIFSGLNNLEDISLHPDFAAICGYTQEELELYFKDYIKANGFPGYEEPRLLQNAIRDWYNGYRFSPYSDIKVYNPFSTLLLFKNKTFQNYWFASGTPKFLIDIIDEQKYDGFLDLESFQVEPSDLEKFDFDNFHLPSVLYQTGYLTIKSVERLGNITELELTYPNQEVKISFSKELLDYLSKKAPELNSQALSKLARALYANKLEEFFEILKSYLATIPYDIQIAKEKYYQSLIFMLCRLISERISAEVRTNTGRVDMLVKTSSHIYIFEFKINDTADAALQQIIDNNYSEPYKTLGKPITLIGVAFSFESRNISEVLYRKAGL